MEMITLSSVKISNPTLSGIQTTVGNTPLLPLARLSENIPPEVQVYAKAEWFNPGGSVKDRPALNINRSAISSAPWRFYPAMLPQVEPLPVVYQRKIFRSRA